MTDLFLLLAAAITSALGVLGGLGGAVLLVPALVLTGTPVASAAPLGLMTVAAGSVASGSRHLVNKTVNHRLGVSIGLVASIGAISGAMFAGLLPERPLIWLLAAASLTVAFVGGRRTTVRNPARQDLGPEEVGERVGSLSGAYASRKGVASYRVRRVPIGLGLMGLAGLLAGTTGASGGFIITPVTSEVMNVPTRVAAATTTFAIGLISAAGLLVFLFQGRIAVAPGSATILGSLIGAWMGVRLQSRLPAVMVRRALSVLLVVVAVVLVVAS
jgi:uncharacterized membrane protein YfcA